MMFLYCPAYLDQEGAVRCGLPAEVRSRFTMRSTDGPVESAMIRCPAGHYFCGAIESLTWDGTDNHDPGTAAPASPPDVTASSMVMMTVAVAAGPPCGISPPSRSGTLAGRTPLPRTTWATRPPCGSPSCARAAGPPPPVTRWKPLSAAVTRPGTPVCSSTADFPVIEDPVLSYAEISAILGVPAGSIGPSRRRCLDKLRRYPAITALINAGT